MTGRLTKLAISLTRFGTLCHFRRLTLLARVRTHACILVLAVVAMPVLAQEPVQPQVAVTLDPEGPVTVGTPVGVTVTVLVPTYMPEPPDWPDLQIADAVTRLPERATHPVTERVGGESWSGIARRYEIVPQRAADYALDRAELAVTYADPDSNAPLRATLPVPEIAFAATVPPGAGDMDPFLAATSLGVATTVDGLPEAAAPGDAFTLTVVTTADGPPAMLLPSLADRIATPAGLRAYPREPVLDDGPPTTRTEAVVYVVEAPGSYVLPGVTLDWWNLASDARATAATDPVTVEVPAPAGWSSAAAGGPVLPRWVWALAMLLAAALAVVVLRARRRGPPPPSEGELYRRLRRSIRSDPPNLIRQRLGAWEALRGTAPDRPDIEAALRPLERARYGRADASPAEADLRGRLLEAVEAARGGVRQASGLPRLNPPAAR